VPLPQPSAPVVVAFIALAAGVAAALPLLLYRADLDTGVPAKEARRRALIVAALAGAWMLTTALLSHLGVIRFERDFPNALLVFPAVGALGFSIGLSSVGRRLAAGAPLALLVGLQGFRLPLELAMHQAAVEGVMPVQMSYSGNNFDIVTGATALLLAPVIARGRAPKWLIFGWNVLGVLLLLNILAVAALSTPTVLRRFHDEPANVFVEQFPFIWLPTVLVVTAIWGHIVIFRALRALQGGASLARTTSAARRAPSGASRYRSPRSAA
jgi:hypothetical protein